MSEDHSHNEEKTKTKPNDILTLFLICIAFSVPFGLWFSVVYDSSGGIGNSMLIFLGAYIIAFLTTLLYYRMAVQDDVEAKIDKISKGKVTSIAGTTFAAFLILLITVVILAINPDLITIFENSLGIWVIGILGYSDFINEIFKSSLFGKLRESSDPTIFNQNFLLTLFDEKNIEPFIDFFKKDCGKQEKSAPGIDFPFDFYPVFENEGQLTKLLSLVKMKRLVGNFTWFYLTSIISLLVSLISVTMKTM
jgi:hypothetical protein